MKLKNIAAVAAAAALSSLIAVSASAADWSKGSYADDDPGTTEIVSYDEDSITFTQPQPIGDAAGVTKCRITLIDVLENPDDVSKIYSGSWTMTYSGLTPDMNAGNGFGGGAWVGTMNSTGGWVSPDFDADGNPYWANPTVSYEDSFKYLLDKNVPTDAAATEYVFMDWSGADWPDGVTLTISDLKLFDKDGNEIPQKSLSSGDAAPEEEAPAEEPEEAEAPADDTAEAATEEAPAEETPASDDNTTSAPTGNASAAAIAGVMGIAAASAVIFRKKK